MKRFFCCLFLMMALLGCATTRPSQEEVQPDPKKEAMKVLAQDMRQGLDSLDRKDDTKAAEAFIRAFRNYRTFEDEGRAIVDSASDNIRKVVEISGFEYAKKESFSLLLLYLDMYKEYMYNNSSSLQVLAVKFNSAYQDVQQKTAEEKQKRLEELGSEVVQKRDDGQKPSDSATPETYPVIYVVKKGDTLPSIAARHEIYNDSFMWPLIYKANRDQIKDPKVLYTGQDLKVPREVTMEDIVEARREAGAPEPDKIPKDAYIPKGKKK